MAKNEKEVEEVKEETTEEQTSETSVKEEYQKKIEKQIQKSRDKMEGKSRILEYLKTEHKWENYVFLLVSIITLELGCLILTGALSIKSDFPLIGQYPTPFAICLVVIAGLGVLYALWPFVKPALPEFRKITWLKPAEFIGNVIRTFLFITIFALLFLLYDQFIAQVMAKIFG